MDIRPGDRQAGGIWELADRFFDAVSRGDLAAVEALYSPDAVVWHNFDDAETSPEQNLRLLRALSRRAGPWAYTSVRRLPADGGFVQQHVVEFGGEAAGVRMPVMMRIYCDSRQIHRIEEYADPAPLNARLRAAHG